MTKEVTAVVATKRINGKILPGTIFVPADYKLSLAELTRLEAVRVPTEAELAVHEKRAAAKAGTADKPRGRGRGKQQADADADNGNGSDGSEGGDATGGADGSDGSEGGDATGGTDDDQIG